MTWLGLVRYHVLFAIDIASRKVEILGMAANSGGPWMEQMARNLVDAVAFDVCQHYRDVRNATVHRSARDKMAGCGGLRLQELLGRVGHDAALGNLHAPNSYESVCFDDFLLFTRSAKALAEELCEASRPTDEELAEIVITETGKLAGKLRKAPERLANARSGLLQTTYSISKEEADRILSGLLA